MIGKGWHVFINHTQYGGNFGLLYAFGTPRRMNTFEITSSLLVSNKNYHTYIDNLDFSWTPLANAPVLSNGNVSPATGTTSTLFNFSVIYSDTDNNPPESVNLTIDGTQTYQMSKQTPSDWNFTDGCVFTYNLSTTLSGAGHTYLFTGSDGNHVSTLGPLSGPVIDVNPVANFDQNVTSIIQGQKVAFTFTGSDYNTPSTFSWNFGDGTAFSTDRNPMHQYDAVGTFSVTLNITDFDGDFDTMTKTSLISVAADLPLAADFIANMTTIVSGNKVQFTFTGAEGNPPVAYQWTFGDATANSTVRDPVHQFNTAGVCTVVLTVRDVDGDMNTLRKASYINVSLDVNPAANFNANVTSIVTGQSVLFTFTGSIGNYPATFQYNFGDGMANSTVRDPAHQFTNAGLFTVVLTVQDFDNDKNTLRKTSYINVSLDVTPTSNFNANVTTIVTGQSVLFTFTGSIGNYPATLQYNFGDGTVNSTARNPVHQFNTAGIFTITATVQDVDGDTNTLIKASYINVTLDVTPVANFAANITSIYTGDSVLFTFTGSIGNYPATFQYNFGDGTANSTARNPVHLFNTAGLLTITLTVRDVDGNTNTLRRTNYLNVTLDISPVVTFGANTTSGSTGDWIQFNYTGSPGNPPATFQWIFNDGSPSSTLQNPKHQFLTAGTFSITLIVSDTNGDTNFLTKPNFITIITDLKPVASFTANATNILVNHAILFTYTGTAGDLPMTYQWSFGDGTSNATVQNPVHVYTSLGTFTVTVTAKDNDNDASTMQRINYIAVGSDLLPVASFTANSTSIYKGQSVQFTFNGFEGDAPATFNWSFGDGTANSTLRNPVHAFSTLGTFTITLTIKDNDGDMHTSKLTNFIAIINRIPVADFMANATQILPNGWIQFTFNGSVGDAPATFEWDFGDGTANSSLQYPAPHQYTLGGNYTVTLKVNDSDGDFDYLKNIDYIVVVSDLIPIATFTANTTAPEINKLVQFTFTGFDGDAPASFEWNFGDGTGNSTQRNPTHNYSATGSYTVVLTVSDVDSDSKTMRKTGYITVIPADLVPIANFTANMTTIARNQWIGFTFTGFEGNPTATYQWNFGDGTANSTLRDPAHAYTSLGNFTIILTVMDNDMDIAVNTSVNFVHVINLVPVASFTANNTSGFEGTWIQFTFTGLEGDLPAMFFWVFGDSSPISNARNPVHQYNTEGNYTATLTVLDSYLESKSFIYPVPIMIIKDLTPVANFTANKQSIIQGQAVQFTFTGQPGNAPVTYQWNFGDGSGNATLRNPLHVFATNGSFTVNLTVMDSDGDESVWSSTSLITVIYDIVPVADFSADVTTIDENGVVAFTFTGVAGNPATIFQWNFGDGSDNSTARNPVHRYVQHGTYTVTLTIMDADGDTVSKTIVDFVTVNVPTNPVNEILKFITDNLLLVIIAAGAMVGIITVVSVQRKKKAAVKKRDMVAKGKAYIDSISAPSTKVLTVKESVAKARHLFVFHKEATVCLLYYPFTEKKFDPQLIAGFLSAITSFGGTFDSDAQLKVLEYQSFKILMEETPICRYALLFQGDFDNNLSQLYNAFISDFEAAFGGLLATFNGDATPFEIGSEIVERMFDIKQDPSKVAANQGPSSGTGNTTESVKKS
nr:PKD domain-containing protein [Candidatus Sigynarchaeota archaeon]